MIDYLPNNTSGFEVTERGIEQIVRSYGNGSYFTRVVIPKEVFIEAYEKFIKEQQDETR